MATSASASITTTAQRIDNLPGLHQGQSLILRNGSSTGTEVINIGGDTVSASQGYALAAGAQLQVGREPLYAIRASGSTGNIPLSVLSLG